MGMKTTKHNILQDFIKSEQRIREATKDTDYRGLLRDYMAALCVLSLVILATWLLWQISGGLVEDML